MMSLGLHWILLHHLMRMFAYSALQRIMVSTSPLLWKYRLHCNCKISLSLVWDKTYKAA